MHKNPKIIICLLMVTGLLLTVVAGVVSAEDDATKSITRAQNCPKCDLRYGNFADADLSGAQLSGAYLFNASFKKSVLQEAHLESSVLVLADLDRA